MPLPCHADTVLRLLPIASIVLIFRVYLYYRTVISVLPDLFLVSVLAVISILSSYRPLCVILTYLPVLAYVPTFT